MKPGYVVGLPSASVPPRVTAVSADSRIGRALRGGLPSADLPTAEPGDTDARRDAS
ncbi:hypothetical protein N1027_05135 [Herbiconiux sp. CPCC 205763]|uniref:Uncharacterized protein n=1 Tax=Herbiconiux aconitum TaxID=2970913 RepID=A0ABT2GMQ2_9MICO|nr:hypothetical protein [Herbiconiux aconitum]MCS5717517.1 hypothetical protein [Herbiconiux aconitum]